MKHHLRMLLGCLVPMLLVFILPLLGFGQGASFFIFVMLMFGCHLMMLGGRPKQARNNLEKGFEK